MNANVCIGNSGFFTCHMFQTQYESFEIHFWILVKKLIFFDPMVDGRSSERPGMF